MSVLSYPSLIVSVDLQPFILNRVTSRHHYEILFVVGHRIHGHVRGTHGNASVGHNDRKRRMRACQKIEE